MNKYKINGKTIYSEQPIIMACGECSNNMNGIWGMNYHTNQQESCKRFKKEFKEKLRTEEGR